MLLYVAVFSCVLPLNPEWLALRQCHVDLNHTEYLCSSSQYEQYFTALSHDCYGHGRIFGRGSLHPPPNKRLLLFGFSFMAQILKEVVCGGSPGAHYVEVHTMEKRNGVKQFRNVKYNNEVTLISNSGYYQHSRNMEHLNQFFERNEFDIILFMRPHADCFFDYLDLKAAGDPRAQKAACVDLKRLGVGDPGKLDRDRKLWKIMQARAKIAAIEVLPWKSDHSRIGVDTSSQAYAFADKVHRIDANSIVSEHPCSVMGSEECLPRAVGHQCSSSSVVYVARDLMLAARNMVGYRAVKIPSPAVAPPGPAKKNPVIGPG